MSDILLRVAILGMVGAILAYPPAYQKFAWPVLSIASAIAAFQADTLTTQTLHASAALLAAHRMVTDMRQNREAQR
ncbi:hypothetical protein ACWFRT_13765 [Streptomyces anulatus]